MPRRPTINSSSVEYINIVPSFDEDEPHPTECPARHSARWRGNTVAVRLTKEEAIKLATRILVYVEERDAVTLTAFRFKDGRPSRQLTLV